MVRRVTAARACGSSRLTAPGASAASFCVNLVIVCAVDLGQAAAPRAGIVGPCLGAGS